MLILHADDSVVQALADFLGEHDYTLKFAEEPLNPQHPYFRENVIDLALIGVPLTHQDSYNLCQTFQQNRLTRNIPIIMVGEPKPEQISDAFAAGASDYLNLPLQREEVIARIEHQIRIYRRRQQMSQQNSMLLEEVRERKQVENTLRQTKEKYRRIFENATEGIFQCTEDGHYLSVNPSLAHIYGYDSPEDLKQAVTDIGEQVYVQPRRRDELLVYLKKFEKIVDSESEVYCKDGSKIWISETIRTVRDHDGSFLYYEGIVHDITERRRMEMELRLQRKQADRLLVNILPYQIATRLKSGIRTIAESFDDVTVMFADLVDFTAASGQMSPKQLVDLLNDVFSTFDRLAEHHGIEKIKTIGDAYMVAGGLPSARPDHPDSVALMALDMQQAMENVFRPDGQPFRLRIGINTGPVIAGVIGMRKFAYDLWGDTVNIASRMETTGAPGRIQVAPEVYERLKNRFLFEPRGTITVKGRGLMESYWLIGRRHNV
ncbi:MAG: adenylate/guanylate cyclase domain-containing protein [Cyanobacteria bacterium J06638_20]